jgi:fused signal recognition particle receptor
MKSLFSVFSEGLQKTKTALVRGIQGLFTDTKPWTEETYEELEAALLATDLGVAATTQLVADVRDRYTRGQIATASDVYAVIRQDVAAMLKDDRPLVRENPNGPTVILMVGVNGSGKTTSIAKLAHLWKEEGRKVILGACDTFRAAGAVQLEIWGERLGVPVVAGQTGRDAAAVAFDAVQAGCQRGADLVLVDTAGRQHTRRELMEELTKMRRTIGKALPGAPHEVWLTVDASMGSNVLVQAREFGRLCEVTGLVLTKLDGTGRGGIVVAIRRELGYPVKFIGLGEKPGDLQPFDGEMFAKALFENSSGGH